MKQAVCRKCRREGVKLFLKGERCVSPKCAFTKRPYAPGPHSGNKRSQKLSDYGVQLREKQKAKSIYGIREDQFRRYYQIASRKKGASGATLLQLLETRLDNICYRLGFASSRRKCRQLVLHGHILINNKKVSIPSYQVKPGQNISFKTAGLFELVKIDKPVWLKFDEKKREGKLISVPERDEIPLDINEDLIIEFYSK